MIYNASTRLLLAISFLLLLSLGGYPADLEKIPEIRILAGGDIMLGSWAQATILKEGYDYPFRRMDSALTKADIVFANLEAPFGTGGTPFEKRYNFQVRPDLVKVLTAGHINLVSLANNHMMDFGDSVLAQTRHLLKKNGIHFAGAGRNLGAARQAALFRAGDIRIAFVACSLTFPEEFWATDSSAGTYFPKHTYFYDDIRKLKQRADLLIVSFHWGGELLTAPKKYQVRLAHRTIAAGADLILGHHPHVVQGIEVFRGKIIAYSLGNFVFGSYSKNVRESMLLELTAGKQGIRRCRIWPINVDNREVEFQPRFLTGEEKTNFIQNLQNLSAELNQTPDVISNAGLIKLSL